MLKIKKVYFRLLSWFHTDCCYARNCAGSRKCTLVTHSNGICREAVSDCRTRLNESLTGLCTCFVCTDAWKKVYDIVPYYMGRRVTRFHLLLGYEYLFALKLIFPTFRCLFHYITYERRESQDFTIIPTFKPYFYTILYFFTTNFRKLLSLRQTFGLCLNASVMCTG